MAHNKSNSYLTSPAPDQAYVSVSALEAGYLTLPERLFITDADIEKRTTVPSLSFLIRHPCNDESPDGSKQKTTSIVFDLGLKRNLTQYPAAMASHISQRTPISVSPDVAQSLRAGGVDLSTEVDYVILSHVHWDHVGTPSDFPQSKFLVGSGTLHLLENGAPPHYPREIFDPNLLPRDRTWEFPPTDSSVLTAANLKQQTAHDWKPLGGFPAAIDFFGDGSLYVIDSPGHLHGHVNLLARTAPDKWVFLGGDCCHDVRILKGEKDIAMYDDGKGGLRSVHVNTEAARETVRRTASLLENSVDDKGSEVSVEVVLAHDREWAELNRQRFLPNTL